MEHSFSKLIDLDKQNLYFFQEFVPLGPTWPSASGPQALALSFTKLVRSRCDIMMYEGLKCSKVRITWAGEGAKKEVKKTNKC